MASQAQPNATDEVRIVPVPAMVQIQALLDAVTPEQLAAALPGAPDHEGDCLILGGLTDDMRRLCHAASQLKTAQDADVDELKALAASEDSQEELVRRNAPL